MPAPSRFPLGRIAIGRIFNGTVNLNDPVMVMKLGGATQQTKITKLFTKDIYDHINQFRMNIRSLRNRTTGLLVSQKGSNKLSCLLLFHTSPFTSTKL